jgi:hypothetical protein
MITEQDRPPWNADTYAWLEKLLFDMNLVLRRHEVLSTRPAHFVPHETDVALRRSWEACLDACRTLNDEKARLELVKVAHDAEVKARG